MLALTCILSVLSLSLIFAVICAAVGFKQEIDGLRLNMQDMCRLIKGLQQRVAYLEAGRQDNESVSQLPQYRRNA